MLADDLATLVQTAIRKAQERGELALFDIPRIDIERPRLEGHGDFATPSCLQLAKLARSAPVRIAQAIVGNLPDSDYLSRAEVAGPGYINFWLADAWLVRQVDTVLAAGDAYGNLDIGKRRKAQVEFVSANPTGPLHIGSARNAALGDALANVLAAAGYDVQREYYVNDAGSQLESFAASLYARYAQALGIQEPLPEGGYQGAYLIELGKRIAAEQGRRFMDMPGQEMLKELGEAGLRHMLESIRSDMQLMGIHFDNWFSERTLYRDHVFDRVLNLLRERGHIVERDGAVWLAAKALGADKDEVIIRTGGAPTYFASDIAYHYDKFVLRGFEWVIDVWGADHQGHVPRMHSVMKALGLDPNALTLIIYQLVTLKRGGEVVRLSKRTGEIITLREVLEDVGADAVRFFLVSRSPESQMDFDLDLAKQQSSENPVYYVQYAHARISSILKVAEERGFDEHGGDTSLLSHPMELTLIRHMLILPEVLQASVISLSPHHLATYAQELAAKFHLFYRDCRVVSPEPEERDVSMARLKLVRAARIILARTLHIMGMNAPEHM